MTESNGPEDLGEPRASALGRIRNSKLIRIFLCVVLWLVFLNLASEFLGFYWWNPYTYPKHTASLDVACNEYRDADVMVVGSSFARWGIASPVLAAKLGQQTDRPVRVYNLGGPGVGVRGARARTRVLFDHASPRLLIYPLSINELLDRRSSRNNLFYATHASPYELFTMDFWPPASYQDVENVIAGVFRPAQLPYQLLGQRAGSYPQKRKIALRLSGWHRVDQGAPTPTFKKQVNWPGTQRGWKHLIAMHQMAIDHHCRLVVVRMPYDAECKILRFTPEAMELFADDLEKVCDKHSITFINLQTPQLKLEPSDFSSDGRHLKGHGARKLTEHLAPLLADSFDKNPADGD